MTHPKWCIVQPAKKRESWNTAEDIKKRVTAAPNSNRTIDKGTTSETGLHSPLEQRVSEDEKVVNPENVIYNARQTATNTYENSEVFKKSEERMRFLQQEQAKNDAKGKDLRADVRSEIESMRLAAERLNNDYDGEVERIMQNPTITGVEQDESMLIIDKMLEEALPEEGEVNENKLDEVRDFMPE